MTSLAPLLAQAFAGEGVDIPRGVELVALRDTRHAGNAPQKPSTTQNGNGSQ